MQADKLDQYALGQRVKKITPAQTLYYHYDEAGQLLAETDSQGNVIRDYIYMDAMRVARYDDTTPYYFHNDHLGRPVALTDAAGAIAWQVDYLPFGKVYTVVNNTTDNELGFPGQILDAESGFFYNYFRDYDPETGRYVQSDPLGLLLATNNPQRLAAAQMGVPLLGVLRGVINHNYGYVGQNVLSGVDPTGELLHALIPGAVIGGGLLIYYDCIEKCNKKKSDECSPSKKQADCVQACNPFIDLISAPTSPSDIAVGSGKAAGSAVGGAR